MEHASEKMTQLGQARKALEPLLKKWKLKVIVKKVCI
jgi:hypothetical protein